MCVCVCVHVCVCVCVCVCVNAEFLSKLSKFRVINEEDSTVLNYFDELEVHPVHIGRWCVFSICLHVCVFMHVV